ncbi:cytochrome P450 [Lentzea sp. NBRC 105346]|uniref:cytochrome P450 family protein n=1 Tax=Lentzea sp. NBRC 105346 TaxID=3032205 RepID=UPI0024A11CB2|nr:cytochrome P450 [Lentzea sp. NBRC 105346]GLZ33219.1 cytochrome P450 [Lentzea sp. NBRC 105346]
MQPTFPFSSPPTTPEDPEALRLLEQGPVVKATMGPTEVHLALGYHAVKQVLTDNRFSREEACKPGGPVYIPSASNPLVLTSLDPPRHNRVRKLLAATFSPRMVEQLEPRIQTMVDGLLDPLEPPTDLVANFAKPLPIMVICELLGAPYEDRRRMEEWSHTLVAHSLPLEQIRTAEREIQAYLAELVETKRRQPDERLISELVRANNDDITPDELVANLQVLLTAGHETTINQLGNFTVSLLDHPDQLRLLMDDPSLWGRAIEELFRFNRLTSGILPRVATEDVVLDGVPIPKGAAVMPIIAAANRDPAAYPDPNRLDILREGPAPHTALGHGPHFCLGAHLTKLELRVALSTLFRRFPQLRITTDELDYDPTSPGRRLTSLPVTW